LLVQRQAPDRFVEREHLTSTAWSLARLGVQLPQAKITFGEKRLAI
jgi:hypothetical protein